MLLAGCSGEAAPTAKEELERAGYASVAVSGDASATHFVAERDGQRCEGSIEVTSERRTRRVVITQGCSAIAIASGSASAAASGPPADREGRCRAGDREACIALALAFERGQGVAASPERAMSAYLDACRAGSGRACHDAAVLVGYHVPEKSLERALGWFVLSCSMGFAPGCTRAGLALVNGSGAKPDDGASFSFFTAGCGLGAADACGYRGEALVRGRGTAADAEAGDRVMAKACADGEGRSCWMLGSLLRDDKVLPKDAMRAAELFRRACDLENAAGCNELGFITERGDGTAASLEGAVKLYERSCALESDVGCTNFAVFLAQGKGIAKDPVRASALLEKSCRSGFKRACELEEKLR